MKVKTRIKKEGRGKEGKDEYEEINEKEYSGPIKREIFELLACPACKSDVIYTSDKSALICVKCKRRYEIQDGIPIMMLKD
ncbi:MAG: Trm112 family protein, partial [Nanoarchaeota archaeon]